jgi:hypothetical protein
VETGGTDRTASERVDRVVEGPHALHRPVRKLARKRALAVLQSVSRRAKRTIRVGVVLEDAAHNLEGRPARGRHAHGLRATT